MPKVFAIFCVCLGFLTSSSARAQTYSDYRDQIVQWEGCSAKPYMDRGCWAIGIGHRLTKGEKRERISSTHIETLFQSDFAIAYDYSITYLFFAKAPADVKIIVVSLVFNVGRTGFSRFVDFISSLNNQDYKGASIALHNSLWARQLPDRATSYCDTLNNI